MAVIFPSENTLFFVLSGEPVAAFHLQSDAFGSVEESCWHETCRSWTQLYNDEYINYDTVFDQINGGFGNVAFEVLVLLASVLVVYACIFINLKNQLINTLLFS